MLVVVANAIVDENTVVIILGDAVFANAAMLRTSGFQ
jgi:hypothetical protein